MFLLCIIEVAGAALVQSIFIILVGNMAGNHHGYTVIIYTWIIQRDDLNSQPPWTWQEISLYFYFVLLFFYLQSDIYFVSSAPVSSASNCSSRDTSSQSSPQTPTGYEMPVFPSPLGDGKLGTVKPPEVVNIRHFSLFKFFFFFCMSTVSVLPADLFDFEWCCVSPALPGSFT